MPNKLKTIGNGAFRDCKSLTSVIIPDSVTNIDYWAFLNCDNLTSVTLGANVTSIGDSAFEGCDSLTSVTIPTSDNVISVSEKVFHSCPNITYFNDQPVWINNNKLIAFAPASDVTTYVIPDSVTSIHGYAFYKCNKLTEITIPESVKSIGAGAFLSDSLTSVYCQRTTPPTGGSNMFSGNASGCKIYVPMASVNTYKSAAGWSDDASIIRGFVKNNEIGYTSSTGGVINPNNSTAFGTNIVSNTYRNGVGIITFNTDVTEIGQYAFLNRTSFTSITIPNSVTEIGDEAFSGCSNLASVDLGNGVTSIAGSAFYYCTSLTSVDLGNSVTSIGDWAFSNCTSLNIVTIPNSVTKICQSAFYKCIKLTSVDLGNGVISIDGSAFDSCSSLTSITIPDSVTYIGNSAFRDCTRLTSVYCKATTPPCADARGGAWDAFDNNASGRKIYVPMESVDAYKAAPGWSEYADAIVGYNF